MVKHSTISLHQISSVLNLTDIESLCSTILVNLRSSTILVNLASGSTNLVDLDLVDLNCLANFWWSGVENGESRAGESLPNRPTA
jgi:hypothetical protein